MMFQTILAACLLNGVAAQLKQCDQGGCHGVDHDDVTSLLMTYANVQTRGISGTYSYSVDGDTGEVEVVEKGGSGTIKNGQQCPGDKKGATVACETAFKVSGNTMAIESPDAAQDDDEGIISGDTITFEGGTVWTKKKSLMQTDMDIEESNQVALAAPHKFGSLSATKVPVYAMFLRGTSVTMGVMALAGIGSFTMTGTALGGVLALIPTATVKILKRQINDKWSCARICPMNRNDADGFADRYTGIKPYDRFPKVQCANYWATGNANCGAIGGMGGKKEMSSVRKRCMGRCLNFMGISSKAKLTAISISQCACFTDASCQMACLLYKGIGRQFEKKEVEEGPKA